MIDPKTLLSTRQVYGASQDAGGGCGQAYERERGRAARSTRGPSSGPPGQVASERLSGEAVSLIVKERVAAAGMDQTGFSGHSLRAGFATSAVQCGVSTLKIRGQTGHASDGFLVPN